MKFFLCCVFRLNHQVSKCFLLLKCIFCFDQDRAEKSCKLIKRIRVCTIHNDKIIFQIRQISFDATKEFNPHENLPFAAWEVHASALPVLRALLRTPPHRLLRCQTPPPDIFVIPPHKFVACNGKMIAFFVLVAFFAANFSEGYLDLMFEFSNKYLIIKSNYLFLQIKTHTETIATLILTTSDQYQNRHASSALLKNLLSSFDIF